MGQFRLLFRQKLRARMGSKCVAQAEAKCSALIHPQNEAVGTCKHCFRGVCPQCAKDSGVGLASAAKPARSRIRESVAMPTCCQRNGTLTASRRMRPIRNGPWGCSAMNGTCYGCTSSGIRAIFESSVFFPLYVLPSILAWKKTHRILNVFAGAVTRSGLCSAGLEP